MTESKRYLYVFDSNGDVKVVEEPTSDPGSFTDCFINLAEELFGYRGNFLIMEEDAITDSLRIPLYFLFKDRNTGMYGWDSYFSAKEKFPNLDQLMDKARAIHFLI